MNPSLARRQFLWRSASAALAFAAPTPLIAAADALTTRRVRAGFLGVAYSHAAEKLRQIKASPDYDLVGAWAETPLLARQIESKGIRVLSEEEVLALSEVVLVESEVRTHAALAERALAAGCHVHLEKPPAMRMREFDRLVRLARSRRRLLQVGYMWRHHPGLRTVFHAVRQGWLGEVFLVRGTLNNALAVERRAEWAVYPGGVLFELGSHLVDAIVRLLGRPKRVSPFLKTHGSITDPLADNNVVVFEYPRATAVLTSAALQPNASAHRAFEVFGTRGTAVVRPLEPAGLQLDLAEAAGPYARGIQSVPLPTYRRYEGELAELAAAIRQGTALPVSLETEREVQETLLRASGVIRRA